MSRWPKEQAMLLLFNKYESQPHNSHSPELLLEIWNSVVDALQEARKEDLKIKD